MQLCQCHIMNRNVLGIWFLFWLAVVQGCTQGWTRVGRAPLQKPGAQPPVFTHIFHRCNSPVAHLLSQECTRTGLKYLHYKYLKISRGRDPQLLWQQG